MLAARDGVLAESWLPSGGQQWKVEDDEGGRQLLLASDGISVWAHAERRRRMGKRGKAAPPRVARIAVDTGEVLETVSPEGCSDLVAGARRMSMRPSHNRRKRPTRLMMFDLDGPVDGREVGGSDVSDRPVPVRRPDRPYLLVVTDPKHSAEDKWAAARGIDGTLRRLFPHAWCPRSIIPAVRRPESGNPSSVPAPSTTVTGSRPVAPSSSAAR